MKAVITFHSIDERESVLSFSPAKFAALVDSLLKSGISICTLDELLLPTTHNSVSLTFDDGLKSVYQNAVPVLRDADVPAHLYITTAYVGKDNRWPTQPMTAPTYSLMSWDEIECCSEAGMLIENHTESHPDLRILSHSEIVDECEGASESIADHVGVRPRHFAYPYGLFDQRVQNVVADQFKSCVTTCLRPIGSVIPNSEVPRLDSYYLQRAWLYNRLSSPLTRGYLWGRHLLRAMKDGH